MPVLISHLSCVHTLLSLQTLGVPAQAPDLQVSLVVHTAPSSQGPPSLTLVKTQLPVVLSHASLVHTLLSSQVLAVPAQLPSVQTSLVVQAWPSSHPPPLAMGLELQVPLLASQTSAVQALPSLQVLGVPLHPPVLQVSGTVQALPSSQRVPSLTLTYAQLPLDLSQPSLVHTLLSSQTLALPLHVPPWQLSLTVQVLPSLHGPPSLTGLNTQLPVPVSQLSVVHTLLSSQVLALPTQ